MTFNPILPLLFGSVIRTVLSHSEVVIGQLLSLGFGHKNQKIAVEHIKHGEHHVQEILVGEHFLRKVE